MTATTGPACPVSHPEPGSRGRTRDVEVLVVGAGASGIGAAVTLRGLGITDFVVLEKADSVGGTWRDNTYPGCACDVPSALYSFSFAPNPEWTRAFAGQREIRDYLDAVAERYGVLPHVRCGEEMTRAQWDPVRERWQVDSTAGRWTARTLVAGAGPWNEPLVPDIPGLESFPGWSRSRARSSTPRAGTTTTTWPAVGWRSSAPGRRRSSSFPRSSPRWVRCTCSSAPRSGCFPSPTTTYRGPNAG